MPKTYIFAALILSFFLIVACQPASRSPEVTNANARASEQPSNILTNSTTPTTPVETPAPNGQSQSNRKPTPKEVAKETPQAPKFELWCFWFEKKDKTGVLNEMRSSEESCRADLAKWEYDPIVFGCHKVTEALLQEATIACSAGKDYACSWRDDVKSLLEILKKN